jgi:hypothetical protein
MSVLPEFLLGGESARLFPVLADTSKEGRTLSILLACLGSVQEFRNSLMASLGQRAGSRAKFDAYTEIVCKGLDPKSKCPRPDGLIRLTVGKRQWRALVEAKVGNATLSEEQILEYARLAKDQQIEAIITLSNQFVAYPDHHPIKLPKALGRHVKLFHWSWKFVVTQASLLLESEGILDVDQRFILEEMLRFLEHPSAGIKRFDQMNVEWKSVVASVQAGGVLSKVSNEVQETVACWHQEVRDLCLILSRELATTVSIRLTRAQRSDSSARLKMDSELLAQQCNLSTEIIIPDAAAPLEVVADLRARTISASMTLRAPSDKKSTKARVNWLLRQVSGSNAENVHVRALWPGRTAATQATLTDLRTNPELLDQGTKEQIPNGFTLVLVRDLGVRFAGRRTFIEDMEAAVPQFYQEIGQNLRAWQPPAPKLREQSNAGEADGEEGDIGQSAIPVFAESRSNVG